MKTKETEVLEANVARGLIHRRPGDLKPWPGNPRTHNDKQLAKLKSSIRKFGFTAPVLVDEAGFILSGCGRVQAAIALELPTIPTRVIAGLVRGQETRLCHRRQQARPTGGLGRHTPQRRVGTPDR